MIIVEELNKVFIRRQKCEHATFFRRTEKVTVPAVKNMTFEVGAGERVAFIGPNGAGKSTTLKMLSGILRPTSGHASVAGLVPWRERKQLAYQIGLVFGQRSQLWYHLPVRESMDLLSFIYGTDRAAYQTQLAKLTAAFHLGPLLDQPVKGLSLGQRMRCEIAASLLHNPKILFLDEPTIGLDVTTKAELRHHLRLLSAENGTTIILTSHDTADIEEICDRVILINGGEKLIDTALSTMRQIYLRRKRLVFTTAEESPQLDLPGALSVGTEAHRLWIEIDPHHTPVAGVISAVLTRFSVRDVTVGDVPLDEVIKHIYAEAHRE